MQVSVINTTEPKNVSIPTAMAVGGAAGLAVRYVLPVYKPEMDYVLFNKSDVIKEDNMKAVKKAIIEKAQETFKSDKENEALRLFIKRAKAETTQQIKTAKNAIKKAPQEVQENVKNLVNDLAARMQASKNITIANIKNAVRQQRPYSHFILPGVALGALVAYAYNVVGTIKDN